MSSPPTTGLRVLSGLVLAIVVAAAVVGAAFVGRWWRQNQPEEAFRRGRAAIEEGDPETARRESEHLLQTPGFEPHGHLLKGLMLARSGQYNDALWHLKAATGHEQTAVDANAEAAHCLYVTGRFMDAINAALIALEYDPKKLDARRWLAAAYYDLGAVANAVVELERISADAPSDPRPDRLLGLIAKDGELFVKAIEHYTESLRRDPGQADRESILMELAESQVALGQFDEALATLQKCQRSAASLTKESSCRLGLGQVAEARNRLREALELDPRYFPAKLALGKLCMDTGDAEQAVEVLKEAIQLQPHVSKVHHQLSQALRQLDRNEEADAELKRMLEIQALERQFTDLHDLASRQPVDADIRYRLGDVARKLGKTDLARMWFQAAVGINPQQTAAQAALREMDAANEANRQK